MADIIQGFGPQNVQLRFKDKEDGTHALVVEASVTLGDLTIDNSGVETRLGATTETAAASDTATSGLNGLLKRALARITTLLDRTPALGRAAASASVPQVLATEDAATLASIAGLAIPAHDYVGLTYTGDNLTGVVYKTGGSGGTTVGTLTLAYSGAVLTSVTKS